MSSRAVRSASGGVRTNLRLSALHAGDWLAICGVLLLYAGHWLYGGLVSDTSLALSLAASGLLAVCLALPRIREDLLRLRGLGLPGACFLLVLAVALWTLTAWTPGGPHPVWSYVAVRPGATTVDRSSTQIEMMKLLGLACFFNMGAAAGARDQRARVAVRLTLLFGLVFGLWALVGTTSGLLEAPNRRLQAHFMNANTAGTFFAVLAVLATSEFSRAWRRDRRSSLELVFTGVTLATSVFCIFDTASRGAFIAVLAGLLVFGALQMLSGRVKVTRGLAAGMGLLLAVAAVLLVSGDALIQRIFESHHDKVLRTAVWEAHWRAFLEAPLLGYGLGGAETVNKSLLSGANFDALWNIRAILNVYLQWLEEGGLFGALPMFACIAALIWRTVLGYRQRSRMTNLLAGLLAVDAVFLVHGAFDFGLEVFSIAALWAWLLGMQFSLAQGSSRR